MAANTTPVFTLTPVAAQANVAAANTARDGTGTLVDLVTGATEGTRIDRLIFQAAATTTLGILRVWHYDGTNNKLLKEIQVTAATVSGSVMGWQDEWVRADGRPLIILPATHKLKVTMHNAESVNVFAIGASY